MLFLNVVILSFINAVNILILMIFSLQNLKTKLTSARLKFLPCGKGS